MGFRDKSRITQLAARELTVPAVDRLDPARGDYEQILEQHEIAMSEDRTGYFDPSTGAWVFTALAHANRGYCCGNGCRHCPYERE